MAPLSGLAALALAGCVETGPEANTGRLDVRAAIAQGEMRSPRPATVALASIDGAPEPVIAQLRHAVETEAADRQIAFTDASAARYLLRGYLDAYPTEKGTAVHYVWDVYDASKQRTQRLGDDLELPASPADPWSVVDDQVLSGIAARSTDDIAAYLATTPEASGPDPAGAGAVQPHVN